jgi:mannan endo-1,4-beta-mannosidase
MRSCLAVAFLGLVSAPRASAADRPVLVEDFDGYDSDAALAKAWYRPPHGGETVQTRAPRAHGGGRWALAFAYKTQPTPERHYAAICRVSKWDLSGKDALVFWLEPDGSGRQLTVQMNIANAAGHNIHDLWNFVYRPAKGDTAARRVVVPFSALTHETRFADSPNLSPVFKPEAVIEVALYIGSRTDAPGEGRYLFDDFVAVKQAAAGAR